MSYGQQSIESTGRLRLWNPEEADRTAGSDKISPRMTLSAFFLIWFFPILLEGKTSESTQKKYRDAVGWWMRLTGDPPLNLIDEFTIKEFREKLRTATYRRGKLGSDRRLSEFTQVDHLKAIDQILFRTGPTFDPKKQTRRLLDAPPRIAFEMPSLDEPKAPFEIADARKILASTAELPDSYQRRYAHPSRWRNPGHLYALILTLYYTGFRIGTVLKFRWSMIRSRDNGLNPRDTGTFVHVPKEIVSKTHKGRTKFLHPTAVDALQRLPGSRGDDDLIFQPAVSYSHIVDLHERLQRIAGLAEERWLSPHAWRRTHGEQIALAGLGIGMKLAMNALDHSDEEITREFYVKIEPELIRRLPAIADAPIDARQRKLF